MSNMENEQPLKLVNMEDYKKIRDYLLEALLLACETPEQKNYYEKKYRPWPADIEEFPERQQTTIEDLMSSISDRFSDRLV